MSLTISQIDRRLAVGLLQGQIDCEIIEAADGAQALSLLTPPLPDLVLTDLLMPEVDGLELVQESRGLHPVVPVILMTAKGSEDIAAAAMNSGAASYVPKKRLANDLVPTVTRLLASSKQERYHSRLMHHLHESHFRFVLHNDLELIGSVVAHAQEVLRCLPLGVETERLRVGIALEEALKNSLYHGNLEIGSVPATRCRGSTWRPSDSSNPPGGRDASICRVKSLASEPCFKSATKDRDSIRSNFLMLNWMQTNPSVVASI